MQTYNRILKPGLGEDAKYLSTHNLTIHCDQRYTQEDMRYVAHSILFFSIESVVTLSG